VVSEIFFSVKIESVWQGLKGFAFIKPWLC